MNPKHKDQKDKKQIPLRPPNKSWSSYFRAGPNLSDGGEKKILNRSLLRLEYMALAGAPITDEISSQDQKKLLKNKSISELTTEDLKAIAKKVDSSNPEEKAMAIKILKLKWSLILSNYAKKTSFEWAGNFIFSLPSHEGIINANNQEDAHLNKAERAFWDQVLSDTTKQEISDQAKRDFSTMNNGDFVAWVNYVLDQKSFD